VGARDVAGTGTPEERDGYLFDMEPSDPTSTLSDEDQLSLWVGRVARVHALLEYNLSNVHDALRPPDTLSVPSTQPPGADRLADECMKLLKRADLGRQVVAAGTQALLAAKQANALRNRIVHDMWLPDPARKAGQPPSWNAFRQSRGLIEAYAHPARLDTVVGAHTTLARARLRVSGLFMALHEVVPRYSATTRPTRAKSALPRYIGLMADHFKIGANGDFEITKPE
jgi:hypothetical protein